MDDSATAYELNALEFLRCRDGSCIGSRVVEQWSQGLPEGAAGIELGCGGGYPISRVLTEQNLQLWAMDSSPALVAKFHSRFPLVPVQCKRVQDFDYFNRTFDFALAVGLVFLLDRADQMKLIAKISSRLVAGGRFLMTAPIEQGIWVDATTESKCESLGQAGYERIFNDAGLDVISTYTDEGANNYYDLQRMG